MKTILNCIVAMIERKAETLGRAVRIEKAGGRLNAERLR